MSAIHPETATHRETATGFTCTGDWLDVVEHGEHVSCALIELDSDHTDAHDSIVAWERWRPKADERLRRDVAVRTAAYTSGDDRADDPRWRHLLRRGERFLYLHVMTLVSPYYCDTAYIHASISRVAGSHDRRYRLDVVVADDDLRARMRTLLREYETLIPRWHIAAAMETDTAVAAEGHDLSAEEEAEADAPLHPGVNLSQVRRSQPADD